jgi:hypothetical protein
MSNTGFFPLLNKLQAKLADFDKFTVNSSELKLPVPLKKKKLKKSQKKLIRYSKAIEIPKLNIKSKPSQNFSFDCINSSFNYDIYTNNIGPGSYRTNSNNKIIGGGISDLPRFSITLVEKAEGYLNLKNIKKDKKNNKTQIFETFDSTARPRKIKDKGRLKEFEKDLHITTMYSIFQAKKEKQYLKYIKKIEGFEWRLKKDEIQKGNKLWAVVTSIAGIFTLLSHNLALRKQHDHIISCRILFIKFTFRFIGKMRKILYKIRLIKLQTQLVKRIRHIKKWLDTRRSHNRTVLLQSLNNFLVINYTDFIIKSFRGYANKLKHNLRQLIKIKKSKLLALRIIFEKSKETLLKSSATLSVNFSINNSYISKFYIRKAQSHIKNIKNYEKKLSDHQLQPPDPHSPLDSQPPFPRPRFSIYSSTKDISEWVKKIMIRKRSIMNI